MGTNNSRYPELKISRPLRKRLGLMSCTRGNVPMVAKKCQHLELRRAKENETNTMADVWYCPEPGCTFELKASEAVKTFNGLPCSARETEGEPK